MNRVQTFAFRISNEERQLIVDLAVQMQRSQSDAVRFIVIETARYLSKLQPESSQLVGVKFPRNEQEAMDVSR